MPRFAAPPAAGSFSAAAPPGAIAASGAAALAALFLCGCVGPSIAVKDSVLRRLAGRDYDGAAAALERASEAYGRRNAVLYCLDLGMVRHYAGEYRDSVKYMEAAEKRMAELYTKSATKLAGTLVLNDATVDYAGEPFERALAGSVRALDYALTGDAENAMVEVRRTEEYLAALSRSRGARAGYKDDAYVRTLDSLFYEDAGQADDARISAQAARRAYGWYAKLYNLQAPSFEAADDANSGEVVLIHYAGLAPRKVSRTMQVAWNRALAAVNSSLATTQDQQTQQRVRNALRAGVMGQNITISYPEYRPEPFRITGSELAVGKSTSRSRVMEDVAAIAMEDLKERFPAILTRTIARAAIKYLLSQSLVRAAGREGKAVAELTSIFTNATTAATEVADTRSWTTAPARILMARLRVPAGTYPVDVRLLDADGAVVSTYSFPNVVVRAGRKTFLTYETAS